MGDFQYYTSGNLGAYILREHTGMFFPVPTLFRCEDIISFKNKGYECTLFEQTYWDIKTVSGRIFILIKSPKNFNCDAVLISGNRNKKFRHCDNNLINKRKLKQKTSKEKNSLYSYFRVFANNTLSSDWLTSNAFATYLITLSTLSHTSGLVFLVKDNYILIEMESQGDSFEVAQNYDHPIANTMDIKRLLKEIKTATGLVETLCTHLDGTLVQKTKTTFKKPKSVSVHISLHNKNHTIIWSGRKK